jgi:hypothetical protein
MRKDLIWSVFAIVVALLMFVVVAYATDPNPNPLSPSPTGTTQPGAGPETGPKRPGPGGGPRPEILHELPRVLMAAAVNPQAKNDPEVQKLLDKAIADMQVVQQDEAARNAAFQQFVQAERSGDADASQKARDDLNSANVKLVADARQFNQQDTAPLLKRIHELMAKGGVTPETGGNSRTPHSAPPSEN